MATWTETLYERLLTRLPPKHVQAGWNDLLQEEFEALSSAVDGVSSAYAKLEEVREAVTKLQQGHPTGGRSGLLQTVESTVSLQQELEKKLQKVATGNTLSVTTVERKRKREELKETGNGVSDSVQQSDQASKKRQLADQIKPVPTAREDKRGESDCAEGSEAAWKQVTKAQAKTPDPESMTAVKKSVSKRSLLKELPPYYKSLAQNAMTVPLKARRGVLPDALLALKEWVDNANKVSSQHQLDVIESLEAALSWARAEDSAGNNQHLVLFHDFVDSVRAYVKRLTCRPAKNLVKLLEAASTEIPRCQGTQMTQWVTTLVTQFDALSHQNRTKRLLGVLAAFNQALTKTLGGTASKQLCSSCVIMSEWINAGPLEPHDVAMYRLLLEAMRELAPRLTKGRKGNIYRLVQEMELKLP